jgi:hypothetical protein
MQRLCLSYRGTIGIGLTSDERRPDERNRLLDILRGRREAFRSVARETLHALSLIEIGPSAGLNMIWDSYGVRYLRNGASVATVNETASLVIDCELRGERTPAVAPMPHIAGRLGLELNAVDLSKADDRDWLRALIWPDQIARLARLDRAIELFMMRRPVIKAGDALDLLPEALAEVPSDQVPCVYAQEACSIRGFRPVSARMRN